MKKKLALVLLAALLFIFAAIFFLSRSRSGTRAVPTNLLLITLDTMRADRLGCYGDRSARTPALDALAGEGVLFENCYSPVPVTLPAHCSLFTGRWPIAHGVRNNGSYKLAEEELTLAEKLRSTSYDTGALVAVYVLKNKFGLAAAADSRRCAWLPAQLPMLPWPVGAWPVDGENRPTYSDRSRPILGDFKHQTPRRKDCEGCLKILLCLNPKFSDFLCVLCAFAVKVSFHFG